MCPAPSASNETLSAGSFSAELGAADRERIRRQLGLLEAARTRLPQVPFPHYLAHLRLSRRGTEVDALLTSGQGPSRPRVASGVVIADYAESAHAAAFFAAREGERLAEGALRGRVLERNVVGFERGELIEISTEDGLLTRRSGEWRREAGLPRRALRPRSAAARRQTPSLIDVHLDPAQRRVVELPPGRSVLVLGEAGHGKTTVALHRLARLARLARQSQEPFRVAVIVPSVGLERLIDPLLEDLGLRVDVRVYERWALEQTRRAFPLLARRLSESATASIVRFKRDPALGIALQRLARRSPGAIDDRAARPTRRAPSPVSRGDLQHLFGDRQLIELVNQASRDPIAPHGLAELLEHTRIQFSRPTERDNAHVSRERLRTLDGRAIDAGTPLEDAGSIDAEDCAVLFELDRLRAAHHGRPPTAPPSFDCIVVDEAQELAPLELALIGRSLRPGGSVVVAGDADQQTDPAAFFGGWEASMAALGVAEYERVLLAVNYRCPPKVVSVARRLIQTPAAAPDDPGAPRTPLTRFSNEAHLAFWLVAELREIRRRDPRGSVAVICRGLPLARRLTRLLRHALDARLVDGGDFAAEGQVNVTTVEQVKGLEFDYVLIPDASALTYPADPGSRRALYVAVTRSRHDLVIGSVTRPTALLDTTPA